jgi:predicted dehydrogenase
VFAEYPLARRLEEGERLVELAKTSECVLRTTHGEPLSALHQQLKQEVAALGPLLTGLFVRLTPGRGARPEILFNLEISGPPALFFVYQVYPLVDLFGPAAWVEAHARYVGMNHDGGYQRFVNAVTVGFARGGLHQWTWAGGIEIQEAEQVQRLVLSKGSLVHQDGRWCRSTSGGLEEIQPAAREGPSLEELFLEEVRGEKNGWRTDLQRAFEAVQIGLAAEKSVQEDRQVVLA